MPIHHTKFAIANPHATGISTPQMPMPTKISRAMVHIRSITNKKATPKPMSQRRGVRRDKTIALILSVIVMNVWPGLMTGGRSISVAGSSCELITATDNTDKKSGFHSVSSAASFHLRIWVVDARQVRGAWACVELGEHAVVCGLTFELRHAAVWIVDVAKHDRFDRARLLASRCDLTILHATILFFRLNLRRVDSLHAVSALLHYATTAHCHIRISLELDQWRIEVAELIEIEAPHFVRAVVRTVTSADAAVVNHLVQTFVAVCGRGYRADQFARRVFTMHARKRLEHHLLVFEIAVDTKPMHLARVHHLSFPNHRDVVL